MQTRGRGLDRALPDHIDAGLTGLAHVAGLDGSAGLGLEALGPALLITDELIVHLALGTADLEHAVLIVARRQPAEGAARIAHDQTIRQHPIGPGVSETSDGVGVPQQAVVAAGDDERDAHVHIVLGQENVLALVVHHALLVLAQAVEGFVRRAFPNLARGQEAVVALLILDHDGVQFAAAGALPQHLLPVLVKEAHGAALTRDFGCGLGRLQHDQIVVRFDLEGGVGRRLGRDHQAGGQIKIGVFRGGDAYRLGTIDFQPHAAGGALCRRYDDAAGGAFERGLLDSAGRSGVHQARPGAGGQ